MQAADGPRADTGLQNSILEAELAALPSDADDDRLHIHHALAANYATLGQYRQALADGQHELDLRNHVQGPDHPETLFTRSEIAHWTGESGDAAGALRLFQALLPDRIRVLGPDHPDTLNVRFAVAHWTQVKDRQVGGDG